jgi:serine/threonine protein kinase
LFVPFSSSLLISYLHASDPLFCSTERLGIDGQVKISDFGVSHFFENEKDSVGPTRSTKCTEESQPPDLDLSSGQHLSRMDTDSALSMKGLSHCGMLTKTEGTWCFWSPEMCSINSAPFSGYAADMWAAGICLFAFVTGRLPFYSEVPPDLFDLISQARIDYNSVNLSPHLVSLLKILLEKNPKKRAGLGDCLQHPFCAHARDLRIQKYSSDVLSSKRKLTVSDDDLRKVRSQSIGTRATLQP